MSGSSNIIVAIKIIPKAINAYIENLFLSLVRCLKNSTQVLQNGQFIEYVIVNMLRPTVRLIRTNSLLGVAKQLGHSSGKYKSEYSFMLMVIQLILKALTRLG